MSDCARRFRQVSKSHLPSQSPSPCTWRRATECMSELHNTEPRCFLTKATRKTPTLFNQQDRPNQMETLQRILVCPQLPTYLPHATTFHPQKNITIQRQMTSYKQQQTYINTNPPSNEKKNTTRPTTPPSIVLLPRYSIPTLIIRLGIIQATLPMCILRRHPRDIRIGTIEVLQRGIGPLYVRRD